MGKFKPYRTNQPMLLPASIEDYIPATHLARVVDEVVEELDTKEIEGKYSDAGQHTYHPKIQLKILFYGYATGNRSGRKIARMCETDTAYMYLGQGYSPDFRTINDFRKNNIDNMREYFVEILRMCKEIGMVKVGKVSIDGTKIRANAANRRTKDKGSYEKWDKRLKEEIEEMLKEAEEIDKEEDRIYGKDKRGDELPKEINTKEKLRKKIEEAMKKLKAEKEKINLTDPDARFMKSGNGKIDTNYNGQIAVSEDQIIVAAEVITEANDREALKGIFEQAEANVEEEIKEVMADTGYASYDNYEYLETREKTGYIPDQYLDKLEQDEYKKEENHYHVENFVYDEKRDVYICPEGKELKLYKRRHSDKGGRKWRQVIYKGRECSNCKVRQLCTKQKARTVVREERRELLEEMRKRLLSEEGKEKYKKRRFTVEPPIGNIKHNLGYRRFLLRGPEKVDGEFKLMCIGHNLQKMHLTLRRREKDRQKGVLNNKKGMSFHAKAGISSLLYTLKRLLFNLPCLEYI